MNYLKIVLVAFALSAATAVCAQTDARTGATKQVQAGVAKAKKLKKNSDAAAVRQTARLAKALELTSAQQAKVSAIAKKYAGKKQTKAVRAKKTAEIEAVLTAEQKAKYAELKNTSAKIRKDLSKNK